MARPAAGGDQDMVSGDRLAVHFHGMGIDKAREAFDHVDVVLTQHVVVGGMNAVDIGAAAGDQLLPVEMVDGGIETVVRAVKMNRFADLRRMPHHFFRHAADVDAGAAQRFGFNQRALLAVHGRTVNRGDTAATAADGEVIIMFAHAHMSLIVDCRDCSARRKRFHRWLRLLRHDPADGRVTGTGRHQLAV